MSQSNPPLPRTFAQTLAQAFGSPAATTLIAIIFLCVPALFALTPIKQAGVDPTSTAFANCERRHLVLADDTLSTLSARYFGDARYGTAILLATNMKGGALPYRFIRKPS